MYGVLDISTSGLVAQRTRLNVISANIANKDVILNEQGEFDPYRRRMAIFAAGDPARGSEQGVHVTSIELDPAEFIKKYEPGSQYADADGFVAYPNVNAIIEQMNAMEASRAYEANITTIEATKSMISVALQIIA